MSAPHDVVLVSLPHRGIPHGPPDPGPRRRLPRVKSTEAPRPSSSQRLALLHQAQPVAQHHGGRPQPPAHIRALRHDHPSAHCHHSPPRGCLLPQELALRMSSVPILLVSRPGLTRTPLRTVTDPSTLPSCISPPATARLPTYPSCPTPTSPRPPSVRTRPSS